MRRSKELIWLSLVIVVTVIAYLPAFNCGFTNWDDNKYVADNVLIQQLSWSGIKTYFSEFYFGIYHPLTLLSLALDFYFVQLDPWLYHFNNIVLHLINTLLVFWFIKLLVRRFDIAIIIAILFGVHTLHVESVVWVSARKDVLYSLFFLASLVSYVKYVYHQQNVIVEEINESKNCAEKGFRWLSLKLYYISLILFIFSLFSKGLAVSLSLSLLAIDYFLGRKLLSKKVILEKIPFFILSFFFGIISIMAPKSVGTFADINLYNFYERLLFVCHGFSQYIIKLIYPFNLSAFYPYTFKPGQAIPFEFWFYPVIVLAIIVIFIYAWRFKRKAMVFGISFFVFNIFMVLQFLPIGGYCMADRYTYMPSIGFFFILAFGCYKIIHIIRERNYTAVRIKFVQRCIQIILLIYIILLMFLTYTRCKVWNNSISLWEDVLYKYPKTARAWINKGDAYNDMGNFKQAIKEFDNAIKIEPYFFHEVYINRGRAKGNLGNHLGAIEDFNKAIKIKSNDPQAYFNRGLTYGILGKKLIAIGDMSMAIKYDPTSGIAYFYRGVAKIEVGKRESGCIDLVQAERLGYANARAQKDKLCN